MRGWTARVGLRKPGLECADCWIRNETCTHPELALPEIQANRRYKAQVPPPNPLLAATDYGTCCGQRPRIDCDCPDDGPLDALVERQEQRRRDESLRAAKAKVDALPADQRARLEGEFQRAEREAAAIMRHGRHDPYAQESDDGQVHGPDGWWGGS